MGMMEAKEAVMEPVTVVARVVEESTAATTIEVVQMGQAPAARVMDKVVAMADAPVQAEEAAKGPVTVKARVVEESTAATMMALALMAAVPEAAERMVIAQEAVVRMVLVLLEPVG